MYVANMSRRLRGVIGDEIGYMLNQLIFLFASYVLIVLQRISVVESTCHPIIHVLLSHSKYISFQNLY